MKRFKPLYAAGAGLLALSLAACSSGGGTSTAASTGSASTASTSTSGAGGDIDQLTVAIGMEFDTLDPAISTTIYNGYVLDAIYESYFNLDATGNIENKFCDSYEVSEDGLTWTLKIKDGLTFNDGTPITAEHFEFAFLRAISYGADNAFTVSNAVKYIEGAQDYQENAMKVGSSFDCLTEDHSSVGYTALDDSTIEVKLNFPVSWLGNTLSSNMFAPLPLDTPQHDSTWSITPGYLTNGAYTLEDFNLNDKAVLKKSDSYVDADKVTVHNITFQVMSSQESQAAAFKTGDVDIALSVSTDTAMSYQGTENLFVIEKTSTYALVVNSQNPPEGGEAMADVRVRKALYQAIDKESIVNLIGGEEFYPILNGWIPFGFYGVDDDFRTERDAEGYELTYDPEAAKALLAEAGYDESNPLHITYKYSTNSFHADVATALQAMWAEIGVDADFDAVEGGVYYDQLDTGDVQIGRYGLQSTVLFSMMDNWNGMNQVTRLAGDDKFDEMMAEAQLIVDSKEQNQALHEVEDYLVQEQCYIMPLFQFGEPTLVRSGITGIEVHGTSPYFMEMTTTE